MTSTNFMCGIRESFLYFVPGVGVMLLLLLLVAGIFLRKRRRQIETTSSYEETRLDDEVEFESFL